MIQIPSPTVVARPGGGDNLKSIVFQESMKRGSRGKFFAYFAALLMLLLSIQIITEFVSATSEASVNSIDITKSLSMAVQNKINSSLKIEYSDYKNLVLSANNNGTINLIVDNQTLHLILSPSTVAEQDVRAPSDVYRWVPYRHFIGSVAGINGSKAAISFDTEGFSGVISMNGAVWSIEPVKTGKNVDGAINERIFDATINDRSNLTDMVLPMPGDDMGENQTSKTPKTENPSKGNIISDSFASKKIGNESTKSVALAPAATTTVTTQVENRVLRLLAGTDSEFRRSWSHSDIENRLNWVNVMYQQVGIVILIVQWHDWNTDAYYNGKPAPSADSFLTNFRTVVRGAGYSGYDLGNLFCGREFYDSSGLYQRMGTSFLRGAGTGLFGDQVKTTYGFSWTCYSGYHVGDTIRENTIAHEFGHNLNAVHDQTDPYFQDSPGKYPPSSTIMGYSSTIVRQFSDGSQHSNHNNKQRIISWAQMNLHTVLWTQAVGNYGSSPSDEIQLLNLQVRVLDLPGSSDRILNVQYDLKYTGGALFGIDLTYVYVSLRSPSYANQDFGYYSNVHIGWLGTYHYNSLSMYPGYFGEIGQWRVLAAYYKSSHWAAYYDNPVYIKRYNILASTCQITASMPDIWAGTVHLAGDMTDRPSGLVLWVFKVMSLKSTPLKRGDTVDVYWAAYNTNSAVYSGASFYTACQTPTGSWSDFGSTGSKSLVQRSALSNGDQFNDVNPNNNNIGNPAGGIRIWATSNTLTTAGQYRLIPDFVNGGLYYPWYDSTVYITVAN